MNLAEGQQQLDELVRHEEAAGRRLQDQYYRPGAINFLVRGWRFRKGYKCLAQERDAIRRLNDAIFSEFVSMLQEQAHWQTSVPLAYMMTYFCFVSPRWFDLLSCETFPPALDAWYRPEIDLPVVSWLCTAAKAGGIAVEHQAGCLPVLLLNVQRVQERDQDLVRMSNSIDVRDVLARMAPTQFPDEVTAFVRRRTKESQPAHATDG